MSGYDDLVPDKEFLSGERAISTADVAAFADLTGDMSALHIDAESAAAGPYGRPVAHGMLILSCSIGLAVAMKLWSDDTLLAFAGIEKLRFTAPVFPGDTIAVRKRVVDKQPLGDSRGLVTFDSRVVNQRGEIVIAYVDRYVLRR
jgi:3-hydroxybutyryl-CoA dehydratase